MRRWRSQRCGPTLFFWRRGGGADEAAERVFGFIVQVWVYQDAEEAKGVLLVRNQRDEQTNAADMGCRFSVPHDRLFLDALERDLKREKDGQDTTTEVIGEPARSFR